MAQEIYGALSAKGALVPASNVKKSKKHHRSTDLKSSMELTSQVDAVAAKVIQLMKQHHMKLVEQKASIVAKSFSGHHA